MLNNKLRKEYYPDGRPRKEPGTSNIEEYICYYLCFYYPWDKDDRELPDDVLYVPKYLLEGKFVKNILAFAIDKGYLKLAVNFRITGLYSRVRRLCKYGYSLVGYDYDNDFLLFEKN